MLVCCVFECLSALMCVSVLVSLSFPQLQTTSGLISTLCPDCSACLLVYVVVCLILCVGTVCLILVYFVVRLIRVCFVVCLNARVFDTWCFNVCLNACAFHIQLVAGLLRYKSEICVGHLPITNCQLSANCSNTDSNVVLRF